jgi:hypothetical protein
MLEMSAKNRPRTEGRLAGKSAPLASQHMVDVKTSGVRRVGLKAGIGKIFTPTI